MLKPITPNVIIAIRDNLVEFGYALVKFGYDGSSLDAVQAQVNRIVAGDTQLSIIGEFAKDMLVKNGYMEKNQNDRT